MGEEKGKRKGCGGGGKSGVGREGERAGRRGEMLAWCLSWKNGLLVAEQLRIKNAAKSNSIYSLLHIQQLQTQHMTRAAAAKSHHSCPTLCDPIDGSPPGSPIPGILQARTLEWVAISFSNAWKWKAKVKSLSHVRLLATPWTAAYQASPSMGFSRQEYWSGLSLPSPYDTWSTSKCYYLMPSVFIQESPATCRLCLSVQEINSLLTMLYLCPISRLPSDARWVPGKAARKLMFVFDATLVFTTKQTPLLKSTCKNVKKIFFSL